MKYKYKKVETGCPVGCRYCVITKVDSRREMWSNNTIIGINKAVTIINPPPCLNDKKAVEEFYNFPLGLLKGDCVGFCGISDPFWPKYKKELWYVLENVSKIAKVITCVTKFNPPDEVLKRLAKIPNFKLAVSITGLDKIEKTKTKDRLDLLLRAKKFGICAFPIVHPYIGGMSDISFLDKLVKMGYKEIDFKGLRFNKETMKDWMPVNVQKLYQASGEKEFLVEDGWRKKLEKAGIKLRSLKDWYKDGFDSPKLSLRESKDKVNKILQYANITSSDTDEAVIDAAIRRRM